VSVMFPTKLEH